MQQVGLQIKATVSPARLGSAYLPESNHIVGHITLLQHSVITFINNLKVNTLQHCLCKKNDTLTIPQEVNNKNIVLSWR